MMNTRKKTQMQGEDEMMRDTVNYHYAMNSFFVTCAPKMLTKVSNTNHETLIEVLN